MENVQYVGLDVHKKDIRVAVFKGWGSEPEIERDLVNQPAKITKFFEKLKSQGSVQACYEAGCVGFETYRLLKSLGVECMVVAPGLVPRKPGERIRTDRRDARKLGRNLRNGEVTSIQVPTPEDEAVRDYLRMQQDFKEELKRSKQRLLSLLLRHGFVYREGNPWSMRFEKWMKSLTFEEPLLEETFEECRCQVKDLKEKIGRMQARIEEIAQGERYRDDVGRLQCLKGIATLTALSVVAEVGDFRRFMKAGEFMAFVGLVPSEDSSGSKRRQGGITKAGNSHLRRLLVEASWHYRHDWGVSSRLAARRKNQGAFAVSYANKAGKRLNRKFRLMLLKKKSQVAVTAVARELAGFVWGMMTGQTA